MCWTLQSPPSSEVLGTAVDSSESVWKNINRISELKKSALKGKGFLKRHHVHHIQVNVSSVSYDFGYAIAACLKPFCLN